MSLHRYWASSHGQAATAFTNRTCHDDANGNMTLRTISGTSYMLGYNAGNR
jgi:hypothetical protein